MINKLLMIWAKHEKLVIVTMLVAALLFPVIVKSSYLINIGLVSIAFAILALSLNLITGFMGIVSLGHAAFFGIGAYTSAIISLRYGWNFSITFILAAIVSALFGILLGLPTLRLSGKYLSIVTLSFCEIIRIFELNLMGLTRGARGLPNIPAPVIFGLKLNTPIRKYYLALVLCMITVVVISRIMNSRIGRGITAVKNDLIAAEAMGIVASRYKLMVFAISSALAGLGGAFYAHYISFIDPSTFSFDQSIKILSMVILGGTSNIYGSILGSIILVALPEVLRPLMDIRQVLFGALLIIMILIRPKGILGGINLNHIRQQNSLAQPDRK